jgi:hypothetical protein
LKVRIVSTGEYDRHEDEVRFIVDVGNGRVSVTITTYALFIIGEALCMPRSEPLTIYAASGQLLNLVVSDVIETVGDLQPTYFVTHQDVLRVTGCEAGLTHVPKRWKAR